MNNMNNIDKVYCKKNFEYTIGRYVSRYVKGGIYNSTSFGDCIFIYMNNNVNGMWFGDSYSYKFRNFHEYFIDFKSYERKEKLRIIKERIEDE
jgi:hypothetical protein